MWVRSQEVEMLSGVKLQILQISHKSPPRLSGIFRPAAFSTFGRGAAGAPVHTVTDIDSTEIFPRASYSYMYVAVYNLDRGSENQPLQEIKQ